MKADDSDPLDNQLAEDGVAMMAAQRANRTRPKTQAGGPPRRYTRRWKVEHLIAWLQNVRRVILRYE